MTDKYPKMPAVFKPINIAVLTVSDTRTQDNDTSGKALVAYIAEAGHVLVEKVIVPDDKYLIRVYLSRWIADEKTNAVLITGGTGLTGRDITPEAVAPLFDKTIDGFGELFRAFSYEEVRTSTIQSRALAGVANGTFIFCLPGSTSACKLAWEKIIQPQLDGRNRPCNLVELMPRTRET